MDKKTGRRYFANKATRETTWTMPDELKQWRLDNPTETGDADAKKGAGSPKKGKAGVPAWVEKYDPKNKRKYYVNKQTGKSSWTKPDEPYRSLAEQGRTDGEESTPDPNRASPRKKSSASLKTGWVSGIDPKTKRTYYYNRSTKETTWKKPADYVERKKEEGWTTGVDPKTKRVYYYNRKTKETTWTKPKALGGKDKGDKDRKSSTSSTTSTASPKSGGHSRNKSSYDESLEAAVKSTLTGVPTPRTAAAHALSHEGTPLTPSAHPPATTPPTNGTASSVSFSASATSSSSSSSSSSSAAPNRSADQAATSMNAVRRLRRQVRRPNYRVCLMSSILYILFII